MKVVANADANRTTLDAAKAQMKELTIGLMTDSLNAMRKVPRFASLPDLAVGLSSPSSLCQDSKEQNRLPRTSRG